MNKRELTIALSKLKGFEKPKLRLRQYLTPPSVAADLLWTAYMQGDLEGRKVFDLGCGTGMLSVGASLLGASVIGYDLDEEALMIARVNARGLEVKFVKKEIDSLTGKCDTVVMNPPFMIKEGKGDRVFLTKAFELSDNIYSIHNLETSNFIRVFSSDNGYNATLISEALMPLEKRYAFHKKEKLSFKVGLWVIKKR